MEEKELVRITKNEDGVMASWHGNKEDLIPICLAISDFARRNPIFAMMLLMTLKSAMTDGTINQYLEENSVEMPGFDFNDLLHKNDNEG